MGKYFKLGLLFLLVLLFSGYNLLTALSLVRFGQANLIPAYMIALVSFIIFFFSLMQSNGILFDQEELDRLIVLPLSIREIVYEKSAFLYLLNSVFAVLLMLPAGLVLVWIWCVLVGVASLSAFNGICSSFSSLFSLSTRLVCCLHSLKGPS